MFLLHMILMDASHSQNRPHLVGYWHPAYGGVDMCEQCKETPQDAVPGDIPASPESGEKGVIAWLKAKVLEPEPIILIARRMYNRTAGSSTKEYAESGWSVSIRSIARQMREHSREAFIVGHPIYGDWE